MFGPLHFHDSTFSRLGKMEVTAVEVKGHPTATEQGVEWVKGRKGCDFEQRVRKAWDEIWAAESGHGHLKLYLALTNCLLLGPYKFSYCAERSRTLNSPG